MLFTSRSRNEVGPQHCGHVKGLQPANGNNSMAPGNVARRLTLARLAYGLDQQAFGARAGLSQPQYNQFETGKRLLTLQSAMRLCDEYNLTLDWLYRDDPSGLPADLWLKIRAIQRNQ